jgi:hypothetical protein
MPRHTTPREPNFVTKQAPSGNRVDQRERDPALAPRRGLQVVAMIWQARVVIVGGGMMGGEPIRADGRVLESEPACDRANERLRA